MPHLYTQKLISLPIFRMFQCTESFHGIFIALGFISNLEMVSGTWVAVHAVCANQTPCHFM